MKTIEKVPVESSTVKAIWFEGTLFVEFKSKSIYTYLDVPKSTYEKMLAADSVGKYLNKEIKGVYEFKKIEA